MFSCNTSPTDQYLLYETKTTKVQTINIWMQNDSQLISEYLIF